MANHRDTVEMTGVAMGVVMGVGVITSAGKCWYGKISEKQKKDYAQEKRRKMTIKNSAKSKKRVVRRNAKRKNADTFAA